MNNHTLDFDNVQDEKSVAIFENQDFGTVAAIDKDGDPWFVAKDISDILGYSSTEKMTRRLDDDEKTNIPFRGSPSSVTQKTIINESGLYEAIFGSKMPKAKAFKRWIKRDVLPAIRKTGKYQHNGNNPKNIKQPSRSKIASDLAANVKIAKIFGLDGNQALLSANMMTAKQYKDFGVNPLLESGVELVVKDKVQYLTPSEIGKQNGGVSGKQVNQMLAEAGFQIETRGQKNKLIWVVTEEGKPHCQMQDTGKRHNGTPIMQVKWRADVLNECAETVI